VTKQDSVTKAGHSDSARTPPQLELNVREDGVLEVAHTGDRIRLLQATGNVYVVSGILSQLAVIGSHATKIDQNASNFALGFVDTMKPKDAAEALLLAQMAATHQATMMLARRLNHVESIPQQDAAERALNKTARTFAAQMDTLKRYRSKGQQTVRVERVTVENGGQAVVGSVQHGGRPDNET
tara:strand:- start:406 stop:954 length:549 start_codon:yes stop_codon:yes gene_type:complete